MAAKQALDTIEEQQDMIKTLTEWNESQGFLIFILALWNVFLTVAIIGMVVL